MDAEVAEAGKSLGIEFNYDKVLVTPNTLAVTFVHQYLAQIRAGGSV